MNFLRPIKKNYPVKTQIKDPFDELFNWNDPYFGGSFFPSLRETFGDLREAFNPAIDVSEDKSNIYVKADLPGLKKEDVTVEVDNGILKIKGERKYEDETKDKNVHRIERSYGSFQRSLQLDSSVDEQGIKAKYKDGVLEVTLPKTQKSQSKAIDIDVT